MFQTEPIRFIQSFSNFILDYFFITVTRMGTADVVQCLLIAVIFGVHFRKGFVLLHFAVWTAFATGVLKDFFALPRPYYVDSAVRAIGRHIPAPSPFISKGASSVWALPDRSAIQYLHQHPMGSYGFPSGHTSGSVAVWGGLAVLFQKKWLTVTCGVLMVLIPFSRIYLGRHFIADVLGGYLVGVFCVFIVYRISELKSIRQFLFDGYRLAASNAEIIWGCTYMFGLPLVAMLIFRSHPTYPALLLGLNLGFFMVRLKGLPEDSASLVKRLMRIGIAGLVYATIMAFSDRILFPALSAAPAVMSSYVLPVILMACFAWSATEVNIYLGLMKREK